MVTGREALWLHGVDLAPQGAIHLLVPPSGRGRTDGSVSVERTDRLPDALWCNGFPTAPVPRAVVDACRRTLVEREVREVVSSAPVQEVRAELAFVGGRGTSVLRRVLSEVDRGVRSLSERVVTGVVEDAGLPPPRWSVRLSTVADVHLGVVDAWWDEVGLAWDVDLRQPWSPRGEAAMAARGARLRAVGVVPVCTSAQRLAGDRAGVVAELREGYRVAASLPRPEVVVHLG
ncbi:hypothetical protein BJP25_06615 [Actinokineospora bangkokensis]|uniref:Uncharacterized protein n=1 Tax=Actinokineospora bangkokensis TaxID=1193682 RepID=A0A1Q9LTQ4_9PSEU|nr:hypothetical protein BJP25_06615 [Actinokineospora bangkokensis]